MKTAGIKTAGMIGGIGPESTVLYYQQIVAEYRKAAKGNYPLLILNSIDLNRLRRLVEETRYAELTAYLAEEIGKLAAAGAGFGFLASNTPHIVFEEVQRQSRIPLISIVEATCDEAKRQELKKLALFGTRFTMQGTFYQDVFSRRGIVLVMPADGEQEFIHEKYMGELVEGLVRQETREGLVRIAEGMKEREKIEGLILGGTELSLILTESTVAGLPVLDTTKLHVRAVVAAMLD